MTQTHLGLFDNTRVSLDLSARGHHSNSQDWSLYALGLDLHTVVSGQSGDIGTLTFQPYLLRVENAANPPAIFSDDRDYALQWRIANFNYTAIGQGRSNIRIGHFEVPFGLEQVIQTNGTLNQMNSPQAIGMKADWGYSLNGQLPGMEYEVAFLRGGGNDWQSEANGYFAGRIGLPRRNDWWLGLSGLNGEMEQASNTIERSRVGIDAGIRLSTGLHAMAEYSLGEDDGRNRKHAMIEAGYTTRTEATIFYLQWRHSRFTDQDPLPTSDKSTIGVRYEPGRRWSGSLEYAHQHSEADDSGSLIAQLRIRI